MIEPIIHDGKSIITEAGYYEMSADEYHSDPTPKHYYALSSSQALKMTPLR